MKFLVTILFSVMLTSCPNNNNQNSQEDNSFVSVYQGRMNGSGNIEKQNKIVDSDNEWQSMLSKLNVSQNSIPTIDFSKSTILLLIDSVKNTGGYSVGVDSIKVEKNKMKVVVKYSGPKPTDMVTMAIEQPFHVIKINKTNKEIVFVTK
ncbi:protease complex subunit PrcB family protein [Tenacibaculum sp. S7007]|uniref:Protease complex subunit PrcB family protein n=1 Tax=Tenacibaculum pelagium TaxID=2759527 RepID=A0A839ALN5_9FLAO|nr:protease complex subunit PrcB family protein [Tenacibaculum pelagium]MBA6155280.1 protease complex subunit PrcB family protein [Tenacibaculum pelagium]